jgi:aminoglycoside phosphotransferase family enzyme
MIAGLQSPGAYPHPAERLTHLETHASHVFLAGDLAYKVKKPVNLGFLDFSTLERRRYFCGEELRLNRRLAPDTYLAVVPITGPPEAPKVSGRARPRNML